MGVKGSAIWLTPLITKMAVTATGPILSNFEVPKKEYMNKGITQVYNPYIGGTPISKA